MRKHSKPVKSILSVFLAVLIMLVITVPVFADESEEVWPSPQAIESESALIMEATTSTILYEKDADTKRYPASTTKIMTCLLALENCSLDEMVTFSARAIDLEEAATNIDAVEGETMSMKDCLYGLMLASGNDCANAIAEHVGGSIEGFADMMNARAAEIGCTSTHFQNPSGLFGSEHYTTARDMSLIAQEAFKNSMFVNIIMTSTYTMGPTNMDEDPRTFKNWNELVNPDSEYYTPEVIGGKTGYLDESGRCLVTYAKRDTLTIITVQFKGAYTGIFTEASGLINFTFTDFGMRNVSREERRFSYTSSKANVRLDTSAQILGLNSRSLDDLDSKIVFASDIEDAPANLYARIYYSYAGRDLGYADVYNEKTPDIKKASFIQVYYVNITTVLHFALLLAVILVVTFLLKKKKRTRKVRSARR